MPSIRATNLFLFEFHSVVVTSYILTYISTLYEYYELNDLIAVHL